MGLFSRKPREYADNEWVPGEVEPKPGHDGIWHVPFRNPSLPGALMVLTADASGQDDDGYYPCVLTVTYLVCDDPEYPYDTATWTAGREIDRTGFHYLASAQKQAQNMAETLAAYGREAMTEHFRWSEHFAGQVFGWDGAPFEVEGAR